MAKKENPCAALIKELTDILPVLDAEGLEFLLEQARTHRYNMEVSRLNEEGQALQKNSSSGRGKKNAGSSNSLKIERSSDGENYHIVLHDAWKLFSADEMLSMARIAQADGDLPELATRLYTWLKKERSDALIDFGIAGALSPLSLALADLIKKTFMVRSR